LEGVTLTYFLFKMFSGFMVSQSKFQTSGYPLWGSLEPDFDQLNGSW
jgi:hypothetical protein